MIRETRNSFPQRLENKINSLLDEAEPNSTKAFQIYKTLQREELWNESFESFSRQLNQYFQTPRPQRRKSDFDACLERPMSMEVYENFHLDFHNSRVNNKSVMGIAQWAHHNMRMRYQIDGLIVSNDVLHRTLKYITSPPRFEKSQDITFEDFTAAWKKVVFHLFGRKYDRELETVLLQINRVSEEVDNFENEVTVADGGFVPGIYLTQTEIDWTMSVQLAVKGNEDTPRFPLSRGPEKMRLLELSKTISLYKIVRTTQNPDFISHREKIRSTIIELCDRLLKERAR
jgi:hypothetical protein